MTLAALVILYPFCTSAQKISNTLVGYYRSIDSASLISEATFSGDGKAVFSFDTGYDFVQFGDTVAVIPDKSYYKFLLRNDTLFGQSYWVKDITLVLQKDSVVENRQTDISVRKAPLVYRYYHLFKSGDDSSGISLNDLTADEDAHRYKATVLDSLCNEGFGRGCLDRIGYKILENPKLMEVAYSSHPVKLVPDTSIINLAEKAHSLGEVDAYAVLAAYYKMIGENELGNKYLKTAADEGSIKASMALFEESVNQSLPKKQKAKSTKQQKRVKRK